MTKIVINTCYGGFGLSTMAIKYLVHRPNNGILKVMKEEEYFSGPRKGTFSDAGDGFEISHYDTLFKAGYAFYLNTLCDRSDPLLVEVVGYLGDKANGTTSKLKVVEIPDEIEWVIQEYDGIEWIAEKHRTWR